MSATIAVRRAESVLSFRGSKAALFQAGLIMSAVLLPALCHLTAMPVRVLLPMHWPVLLAGLVYGWRGGLLAGLSAPLVSFALSGMPPLPSLPFMGAEMAAYGLISGLAVETFKLNRYAAVFAAVAAGRLVYTLAMLAAGGFAAKTYLTAALIPGAAAALAQITLLPLAARVMVGTNDKN